jgi:hypothetical protein
MRAVVSTMLALVFGGGISLLAGSASSVAPARAAGTPHALPRATVTKMVAAATDCTIFSGSPTSNGQCGGGSDDTVGTDGNGAFYRTMISFTNLGVPAGSTVNSATLTVNALGAFGSTAATVVDMTRAFSPGAATWDTYDGAHAWSMPGGDFNASPHAVGNVAGAGAVSFSVPDLVQPWVDGSTPFGQLEIVGFSGTGNAFTMAHDPALTVTYTPPPPAPTTTTGPVVTTPVSTPLPVARGPRALRVKVELSWTWNGAHIRLRKVKVGTMPGDTQLTMRCTGGGCPRHSGVTASGVRTVRRSLLKLAGHRYRAGDVLSVKLTAKGWKQERARIFFRDGKKPLILS